MEIWKDIKGYEGKYQISSLGNVYSIGRLVKHSKGGTQILRGRMLKIGLTKSIYLKCSLSLDGKLKTFTIHKLMAINFLGYSPKSRKIVIDHINNIKTDNRLENLQIITNRENSSKDKKGYSSKYIGVYFRKSTGRYESQISIDRKLKSLGVFNNEYDAHLAYQKELNKIPL